MPKAFDDSGDTSTIENKTVVINNAPQNSDTTKASEYFSRTNSDAAVLQEHWFKTFWRPAMGWLYMAICACDFILFPILSMILPILPHTAAQYVVWHPITLEGGGLIHLAFGAVLGVTAWGRSKEKVSGAINEA